jgi:hypothetical protein
VTDDSRQPAETLKPKKRLWFWLGLLSLAAIFYLLFGSTPDSVGPIGITIFFFLLCSVIFFGLMWLRALLFKQPSSLSLLAAALVAILSTGAVALNTIEIQTGEILLLIIFGAMLSIYWLKVK